MANDHYMSSHSYLNRFFKGMKFDEKVKNYFLYYINKNKEDIERLNCTFNIIYHNYPGEFVFFTQYFLGTNTDFESFKELVIDPLSYSSTGSPIPVFKKRIEFLKALLPLLDSLTFLEHKMYVEERIRYWERRIHREEEKIFSENDWD
jgi:hypothetical protein